MATAIERGVRASSGLSRVAVAVSAGGAMALGQAPLSWPLAMLLALPVLLWLLDAASGPRGGFAIGWLAGVGYFTATLFWIVEPFLVDPERHGWMAPFALVGMAGGLALFWAVAFAAARAAWPADARRVLRLAALWTLAEFARTHVLTGFPWALAGYVWLETPVAQTAALFGPHGLGFLTLVAGLLLGLGSGRALAAAAVLIGVGWAYGAWRLAEPVAVREAPVLVRIVQPNAEQRLKWRPEMQRLFYERLLEATAAPATARPDVVIWPESAVPFLLGEHPALQAEIAAAAGAETRVILGIRRAEPSNDGERWFNSLAVLGPDGGELAVYDKHHLVPFGEYVPLGGWIRATGLPIPETLTQTGFAAGPGARAVSAPGVPRFLPLICYEAIFPHGIAAPGGRTEWLVQVTNDAWFGRIAGPHQHLAQARMRAIEQGLPLARAANTGVSAMIDPHGRIVDQIALGDNGYIDVQLPALHAPTFYSRSGDLPWLAFVVLIFGLTYTNFFGGVFSSRRR